MDIRDTDDTRRDGVMEAAFAAAEEIAARRRCGLHTDTVFAYPAATSSDEVQLFFTESYVSGRGDRSATQVRPAH